VILSAVLITLYRLGKIQRDNIIEWLLFAVTLAEKNLGGGTGELKLRTVYNWFIAKYPTISKFISFATFSFWVDIALDKMKEMLTNAKIGEYVKGGEQILENT
jgi:hypothetical protein